MSASPASKPIEKFFALIETAIGIWLVVTAFAADGIYRALSLAAAVLFALKAADALSLLPDRSGPSAVSRFFRGLLSHRVMAFLGTVLLVAAVTTSLAGWPRAALFAAAAYRFVPLAMLAFLLIVMGTDSDGTRRK
jgi:hypothetical protein